MGDDPPTEEHDNFAWHSHSVELDENSCIISITEDGETQMPTNLVTVMETEASSVLQVMTLELS